MSPARIIQRGPLGGSAGLVLYFVRHGEPESHNDDPSMDPPLTPRGRRQASRIARRLAGIRFDHIYVSDLARAYETGEIVLRYHPHAPVTVSRALREVAAHHVMGGQSPLDAEAPLDDHERESLDRFVSHVRTSHRPGEKILMVAHGNLIRTLVPLFAGQDPGRGLILDLHNAALTVLEVWPGGRAVLRVANCTRHLAGRDLT